MDSSPPQERRRSGISTFIALGGMIATFLAGICVGLHPAWIPVKTQSLQDFAKPLPPPSLSPTTQTQTSQAETQPG